MVNEAYRFSWVLLCSVDVEGPVTLLIDLILSFSISFTHCTLRGSLTNLKISAYYDKCHTYEQHLRKMHLTLLQVGDRVLENKENVFCYLESY